MASSLSSVVSDLVRSQMGAPSSNSATEEDLDRHVAEIIVREAKKKAEMYMQSGIRAYTTNNISDSNAPRTNKRFLSSIIKSTDEHNRTVLKAQAQAAEELKRERREQERRQRRLRAEEAAAAERLRRKGKQRKMEEEGWDRWDGRTTERKKVSRNWESWDGCDVTDPRRKYSRRHHRSRSRDTKTSSRSKGGKDDKVETFTRQRRRQHHSSSPSRHDGLGAAASSKRKRDTLRYSRRSESRSPSPSTRSTDTEHRKSKRRRRSRSPKYALDDLFDDSTPEPRHLPPPDVTVETSRQIREAQEQSRNPSKDSGRESPPVGEPSSSRRSLTPMTISRSPTPGPQPAEHVPSKMDRYFEESYDPRLDIEPLTLPRVPATGLINDADFEGWDAMLELIRLRKEDKTEKKRLERLGLLPPKDKVKKKSVVLNSSAAVAERWNGEGVNVMDIAYSKKGTVREWDMGKEGLS